MGLLGAATTLPLWSDDPPGDAPPKEPAANGQAPSAATSSPAEKLSELYKAACRSVVAVTAKLDVGESVSTGFFIGDGSMIATVFAYDAVPDEISVRFGRDEEKEAELLAVDDQSKLALLRVEGLVGPPMEISGPETAPLPLASKFCVVTESEEPLHRVVEGRLAGREKYFRGKLLAIRLLRVHLAAGSDHIGSPLLLDDGKVAGVVLIDIPDDPDAVYALPASVIDKVHGDYVRDGALAPGWLGVSLEEGTTTPMILECRDGGPADSAGLAPGDVILRIGERKIEEYQDVVDAIFFLSTGVETEIEILRGLERLTVKVTPRKKPSPVSPPDEGSKDGTPPLPGASGDRRPSTQKGKDGEDVAPPEPGGGAGGP